MQRLPNGMSCSDAELLCFWLYLSVTGIPKVFHAQLTRQGLADMFAELARARWIQQDCQALPITESSYWDGVITSWLLKKNSDLAYLSRGPELVKGFGFCCEAPSNQSPEPSPSSCLRVPLLFISLALAFFHSASLAAAEDAQTNVDFRYSPPEWQAAICLPDDPQKTLVNKSGELLYHYHQGGREFGTRISLEVATNAVWQKQELFSPRVPIVRTFLTAEGLQIVEEAFAVITPTNEARSDVILVQVKNTGAQSKTISPQLIVDTTLGFQQEGQTVMVNGQDGVTSSLNMIGAPAGQPRRVISLESITIQPGKTAEFCASYRNGNAVAQHPITVARAVAARDRAIRYWQKDALLPFGKIEVPDAGIQSLIDSSIRNIWQAREIKNGMTAFQVGPTCYRGLWIVDGAFLLEAATILGAGDQARNGVAYELTHQKDDGRIEVMKDYPKENGIVLWTCLRHAQLTQDKAWLETVWPKLTRVAEYIRALRAQTLTNDSPLDDGLIPPGFPDGGIGGVHYEYTNPYWNLLGLRAFADAARWLGKADEAAVWQHEYDDFMAAFRKAAARDLRRDSHGNPYLPILMGEAGAKELPQRAQWGFCHAVYPGQIFAKDDPLVAGNMAMLEATEREGMVYGTGWDATGIWNYFASFYGHAWLWQGNGRKAAEILYAYANHAAPVLDWREEQSLRGQKFNQVGDMPHNWASAEFIRLTVHLLALDRGNELHLLEGLPAQWTQPGMVTKLNGIATPFGKLTMEVRISRDGKTAQLQVAPLTDPSCTKIVVHLFGWARNDTNAVLEFKPARGANQNISLSPIKP